MTGAQLVETKEKILTAARKLFSAKGYDGASVREIAAEAGVNIAAVNYHFVSKEKLFWIVIDNIFNETSNQIRARRVTNPQEKVEDVAVWLFGYFLENSDVLRAVFKMMLSENGWGPEVECGGEDEYGPPGGSALAEAIQLEIQHEISEPNMHWAVKMLFSSIAHLSLMYSNHFCKMMPESEMPFHDRTTLEVDIRRLTRVVLNDL